MNGDLYMPGTKVPDYGEVVSVQTVNGHRIYQTADLDRGLVTPILWSQEDLDFHMKMSDKKGPTP